MSLATAFDPGKIRCIAPAGDWCGEGVLWHAEERAVYWTDINRFLIHRWKEREQSVESWFFDQPVTAVLLTDEAGMLLVTIGSGAIFWKPENDWRSEPFFRLPGWPQVRSNDAGVDASGRLWLGSMRNNVNPDGSPGEAGGTDGSLFCVEADGSFREHLRGIGIANTICWSPQGTRFYFADTLANSLRVYEYTAEGLSAGAEFLNGFERGSPDGSAVDADGYLWNCRFGGGCIVRVSPQGTIDRVVEMPVRNITNCTFGGDDLRTLYVTSAGLETTAGDRLAGSLFALRTDTPGQAEQRFRIRR